jgi:hypothetical protein
MTKKDITITKIDSEQNLVFGWAYVSVSKEGEQIIDHSEEMIDPQDLEIAAYAFNLQFRKTGEMHQGEAVGELIESFVATPEKMEAFGLEKNALPLGWWVGFYVPDDAIFAKVKNGTYNMFSIQGTAKKEVL